MWDSHFRPSAGERVYAIGDVHGCEPLFIRLMKEISKDNSHRAPAQTRIILLGDVIDRGAYSAGLIKRLMRYTRASKQFVVLMGNHEQLMITALTGNMDALAAWVALGGDQTLLSFGVTPDLILEGATARLLAEAQGNVQPETIAWLERLPLTAHSGEILFVHAGVRPGIKLVEQKPEDLLGIRKLFLLSDEARDYLTVHGHSISQDGPDVRSNRIGVDTGAYQTGRLTAVGIEGDDIWFLTT